MIQHLMPMKIAKIKHFLPLIFLVLGYHSLFAQSKQTAYIVYENEESSKADTIVSRNENLGPQLFKPKPTNLFEKGYFVIRSHRFLIKPNSKNITFNLNEELNVLTLSAFEKIRTELWDNDTMNINDYFESIYILVPVSGTNFIGVEVEYDYNYFPDVD